MKLIPNWKQVAVRSYSTILALLAFIAGLAEFFNANHDLLLRAGLPDKTFAALSALCALAAIVGRLIQQDNLHNGE